MDLSRLIFCLILFVFSSISLAKNPPDNLGIAFIHGTNDHRADADGGYWKREFIDAVTEGLPNPENLFIVSCDFRQYMWHEDAGGCAAEQLTDFIHRQKITRLIVYTHSNGANVMRWILSNPSYDQRYYELSNVITKVVAIAPSSGGTPLADEAMDGSIFQESLGWLLGYRNDSVRQQRIGDMALFNDELLLGTPGRLDLVADFLTVIGTDVYASPFSSASYCNGYLLNAALKITKMYLEPCSDGFLDCASQNLAGQVWFIDTDKTLDGISLSHNQSRHSCFGFDQILRDDLIAQGAQK